MTRGAGFGRRSVASKNSSLRRICTLVLVAGGCLFSLGGDNTNGISALAIAGNDNSMTKFVLVTGANKGIGRAICQRLLAEHPDVHVLLGARDGRRGEAAVQALGKDGDNAGRLSVVEIDVSSDSSVETAARNVRSILDGSGPTGGGDGGGGGGGSLLYGIVNNAGIGWGHPLREIVNTNYFGPRRVCDAFLPLLTSPGGRIVNVASASGPMFVASCGGGAVKEFLAEPLGGDVGGLDEMARTHSTDDGYGFSKALVNAYTALLAKEHPDLIINSCTPGYIKTDLAPQGTSTPDKGAICPVSLLMQKEFAEVPSGRYYGSDTVRSPLDKYRGPGDPPYQGP